MAADHELLELGRNEGPAGAGPAHPLDAALRDHGADAAIHTDPLRVEEAPADQRDDHDGGQQRAEW